MLSTLICVGMKDVSPEAEITSDNHPDNHHAFIDLIKFCSI